MLSLILFFVSCLSKVTQVYIFQRSAQHTPLITLNKTALPESELGKVTSVGVTQSHNVGQSFQENYFVQMDVPSKYNGSLYNFYSTYLTRTKITQLAMATGLFPNNGPVDDDDQPIFTERLQPIPIRNALPEAEYLLLPTLRCDDADKSLTARGNSAEVTKFLKDNADLVQTLVEATSIPNTSISIVHAIDTLEYMKAHELALPEGITAELVDQLVTFAHNYRIRMYPVSDSSYCNAALGLFLRNIEEFHQKTQNGTLGSPQIYFYGAHRSTLASIFGCLTQSDLLTVSDPLPTPSSVLVVEVSVDGSVSDDDTQQDIYDHTYIRLLRDFTVNETGAVNLVAEKIYNCDEKCPYKTFRAQYSHLLDVDHDVWYRNYCGMHDIQTDETSTLYAAQSIMIYIAPAIFVLGLVVFLLACLCRTRKSDSDQVMSINSE